MGDAITKFAIDGCALKVFAETNGPFEPNNQFQPLLGICTET